MNRLLLAVALLAFSISAHASVRIPNVLGDHMVLQQNTDVTLWGWGTMSDKVQVDTSWGQHVKGKIAQDGTWHLTIHTPAARPLSQGLHPETITFTMPDENMIQIKDVLIGEVWLCSGQSNMEMMLKVGYPPNWNDWHGEPHWKDESQHADRPYLRIFDVEKTASQTPQDDVKGLLPAKCLYPPDAQGMIPSPRWGWQASTPDSAPYFSAVSYYFGAELADKLQVPVGLISSDVGGTPIEAWSKGGSFYNGMINPFFPMTIAGVIWYQGESNVGNAPGVYTKLFTNMITDWRQNFHNDALPFYYVQIAPFGYNRAPNPSGGDLRQDQAAVLSVKNTGMVVTNDIGGTLSIHPPDKFDVGHRLAWQALRKTYGQTNVIADGPSFDSLQLQVDGTIKVTFRDQGPGLISRDGKPLTCFTVAGADGKFVPADAVISGSDVNVSCPAVPQPTQIRFAWGDTDQPNLMSKDGLPAAQFEAPVK